MTYLASVSLSKGRQPNIAKDSEARTRLDMTSKYFKCDTNHYKQVYLTLAGKDLERNASVSPQTWAWRYTVKHKLKL